MSYRLSEPIETLLRKKGVNYADLWPQSADSVAIPGKVEFLIVGSGYGAAMAALALGEHDKDSSGFKPEVWVFERGEEYTSDDFPKTLDDLPAYLNFVSQKARGKRLANVQNKTGLWEIRAGDGMSTLVGSGLGGTSLVNASVAARPSARLINKYWPESPGGTPWLSRFDQVYDKIEKLLGVNKVPSHEDYAKYQALEATAVGLCSKAKPAPVSIDFKGNSNPHGVDTNPCNNCGNCVVGCHSGAKQSLNLNAWPLVKQLGGERASLYTGVSVMSIEDIGGSQPLWRVNCSLSRDPECRITVSVKTVVLAAGTIGSVEILQRSKYKNKLTFSSRLGEQFSANGDALFSTVGQEKSVDAVSDVPGRLPPKWTPGPTIIGMAEVKLDEEHNKDGTFTLEEGAIPFPLLPLWQEMLVTQSLFKRYVDCRLSKWHQNNPQHDYLAVSSDLNRHSQVLLAMGDDRAFGKLVYDAKHDTTTPQWKPKKNQFDYFESLHCRLTRAETSCFDGGRYHPNILWQPTPDGFDGIVEGADELGTTVLSVHPLGGCGIGLSASSGVVNSSGQVYKEDSGTAVHEGLYVLDGAIVPGPIGTNPFITIAAASYVLAHELAGKTLVNGPRIEADFPVLDKAKFRLSPRSPDPIHPIPAPDSLMVEAEFTETLVHYFCKSTLLPWSRLSNVSVADIQAMFGSALSIPLETKALVLEIKFGFNGDMPLAEWLEHPDQRLPATAILYYDDKGSILQVTREHLQPIARLVGSVNLGVLDRPCCPSLRALFKVVPRFWRYRRQEIIDGSSYKSLKGLLGSIRIARLHADFRKMEYVFSADPKHADSCALGLEVRGTKTIGYTNSIINLWGSLLTMDATLQSNGSGSVKKRRFDWEVDAVDITDGLAPLQVMNSLHLFNVLAKVGGAIFYFLRLFLQTHFWSFGAASYDRHLTMDEIDALPRLGRLELPPERLLFCSDRKEKSSAVEIVCHPDDDSKHQIRRLARYQPASNEGHFLPEKRKTLLLIHGLAHSGRIFWTNTISKRSDGSDDTSIDNFTQYFLARNYDVWILDHRTSANYVNKVSPDDRWDDIALDDVTWAVTHIFDAINELNPGPKKKLHVFSHCIGAGAASIAVLAGRLNYSEQQKGGSDRQESMLASLVPHAVAPWLWASTANRTRENIWGAFKNLEPIEIVEPCPHQDPPLVENIFDRLATSSLTKDESSQWDTCAIRNDPRGPMFPRNIYSRYTIIWGRQWVNDNINEATRNEFGGMIGAVPRAVLQQIYSSVTRGMLSDHDGNNVYVTQENIDTNWTFPTLFLHGDKNTVFDQETSKKSAEMLTRHREFGACLPSFWDPITPATYWKNNVWIEIIPGCGHMDMILGKDASGEQEVFLKLDRFFKAADTGQIGIENSKGFPAPGNDARFQRECRAGSHIGPVRRPVTGPIISHPELITSGTDAGKIRLTIWVEAQDFSSIPVDHIVIDDVPSAPATPLSASTASTKKLPTACPPAAYMGTNGRTSKTSDLEKQFWLLCYNFLPRAGSSARTIRRLWVDYQQPGQPLAPVILDWEALDWLVRVCNPEAVPEGDPDLCFLLGSCLYPGTPFDREQMSSVFKGMMKHVHRQTPHPYGGPDAYRRGVDHLLLVGDQIYADASANLMDPIASYEKYRGRYRKAWSSAPARELLSHVPSYFSVDDHECNDNFQGLENAATSEEREEFEYAREMALQYQVHDLSAWKHLQPRLWHSFKSAKHPFFVFDTRFERRPLSQFARTQSGSLMCDSQLCAFEDWLNRRTEQNDEVIFIASGSPLVPVTRSQQSEPFLLQGGDTLLGYPGFLARVFALLRAKVPDSHVCWLAGDAHISCYAQLGLELPDKAIANITQICASGLYAPMSFVNTNAKKCDWDVGFKQLDLGGGLIVNYDQCLLTDHHQHFVRVELSKRSHSAPALTLGAYDAEGLLLSEAKNIELQRVVP